MRFGIDHGGAAGPVTSTPYQMGTIHPHLSTPVRHRNLSRLRKVRTLPAGAANNSRSIPAPLTRAAPQGGPTDRRHPSPGITSVEGAMEGRQPSCAALQSYHGVMGPPFLHKESYTRNIPPRLVPQPDETGRIRPYICPLNRNVQMPLLHPQHQRRGYNYPASIPFLARTTGQVRRRIAKQAPLCFPTKNAQITSMI